MAQQMNIRNQHIWQGVKRAAIGFLFFVCVCVCVGGGGGDGRMSICVCFEVLRPSQPNGVMSVYLTTRLLGRLSPLSG